MSTIKSILANDHPSFELIVVDQSIDEETAQAVEGFQIDKRFRYIRTNTKGVSKARNIGLQAAHSEIVAITDDDCEASPDWLQTIAAIFSPHPHVIIAFCGVDPVPHDQSLGFIPAYSRHGNKLLTRISDKCRARGIGAGMAVRRDAVLSLHGFDEMLGPGAALSCCEEGDVAVRALLNGYQVYETDHACIRHFGFRTFEEGRLLTRRDWFGIGAAYAKPLKCGRWDFFVVPLYEFVVHAIWPPIQDVLCFRRPRGLLRITSFVQGFVAGWHTPVDRQKLMFISINV